MKVMHICTYYIGNKLYSNLINALSDDEIEQYIYIPIRNKEHFEKNKITTKSKKNLTYNYNNILKKYHRLFFFNKIYKQKREIEKDLYKFKPDVIHAHALFSDGGTAYLLKKKYDINYIVNVRNTDINVFYKFFLYLRPLMSKILKNAESVVFISFAYKSMLFSLLDKKTIDEIKN